MLSYRAAIAACVQRAQKPCWRNPTLSSVRCAAPTSLRLSRSSERCSESAVCTRRAPCRWVRAILERIYHYEIDDRRERVGVYANRCSSFSARRVLSLHQKRPHPPACLPGHATHRSLICVMSCVCHSTLYNLAGQGCCSRRFGWCSSKRGSESGTQLPV
jgi:hypothetical protein